MEGTAGILVRAVAVAAALTSTSLRERWREEEEGAAPVGGREWAVLAAQTGVGWGGVVEKD